MTLLEYIVLICGLIILINLVNNRFFHRQKDIFLVLATFVVSVIILLLAHVLHNTTFYEYIHRIGNMEFEEYLMNCVLCFMLFAGAKDVSISRFEKNFKPIILLSLLSTAVSAIIFGLLFYGIGSVVGINLDIFCCLLLGCIVSPTDPIAATGILSKMGLSDDAMNIIECESLFNDGAGVTLYVFVKSIIRHSGKNNFFLLMGKEIFGAILIAIIISVIGTFFLKHNKDTMCTVLISIFSVGLIYILCDKIGCSGAIASVVCGMYFGAHTKIMHKNHEITDEMYDYYSCFWDMADGFFNSILFGMIGICLLSTVVDIRLIRLIPVAIVIAVIARFVSVYIGAGLAGKEHVPAHYTMNEYVSLMTWCALRGGLSLALAMSSRVFLSEESYYIILNSVYTIIFFTVVFQGLSIRRLYQAIESRKNKRLSQSALN